MYDEKQKKATMKYYAKMMRVGFPLKPDVWREWKNFANELNIPFNTMVKQSVYFYMLSRGFTQTTIPNEFKSFFMEEFADLFN